ncbi:hypothetical protein JW851_01545 [Candidatus Woesearchaeota archaeon]|nr:hypothetical protein [Candidatus Woesearchaeota archaeon]
MAKKKHQKIRRRMNSDQIQGLVEKYKQRLKEQLELKTLPTKQVITREYKAFKKEAMPGQMNYYEKACNFSSKILKIKVSPKKSMNLKESINICHLETTPTGIISLSIIFPIIFIFLGAVFSLFVLSSIFFLLLFLFTGIALIFVLQKFPEYLANKWRMKASNQMVLCIFYVVTYMRHTSNLENAVEFASEHLAAPLSLDLKKIIWNVQTGVHESVKESLDSYLETWRKWNSEFVEAFHLIESSLYESSEERRLLTLEKSLDTILEQTYEKMLHYAQNLKSPITMLHMMGIVLPILGLVVLPLVVSFMENIRWWHIAAIYNVILPIVVYFFTRKILTKRPTGYGDTDITELNPELKKYKNIVIRVGKTDLQINPLIISGFIGLVCLIIALLPVIIHWINPLYEIDFFLGFKLLGYRESLNFPGTIVGPYGLGASIISLLFPISLAFSIGLYYHLRSGQVIKIREKTRKLENEFSSALFQLGNRLGDGIPAETAFSKVAIMLRDTVSGRFFQLVATNISKLGMGVKQAIFNPKSGAIVFFPSEVIRSSMKVLIESINKGPKIAAQALLNVARYIKEIHRVNERLKDLLADILSDIKSQIAFMAPAIAGIVIGITSMITYILSALSANIQQLGTTGVGDRIAQIASLFGDGIPTYYFQLVVGVYVFQIVYILTILANGIENGEDRLQEKNSLGKNLIRSTILYVILALIVMLVFNLIASQIITVTGVF